MSYRDLSVLISAAGLSFAGAFFSSAFSQNVVGGAVPPAHATSSPNVHPQSAHPSGQPAGRPSALPPTGVHAPNQQPGSLPVDPEAAAAAAASEAAAAEASELLKQSNTIEALLDGLRSQGWVAEAAQVFRLQNGNYIDASGRLYVSAEGFSAAALQEFGCKIIIARIFSRTQRRVAVEVCVFEDPNRAYGAYSTMREGSSTVVVRGGASSEDDSSVSFWKGRYFVVLKTPADEDEVSKELITALADQVAAGIQENSILPAPISRLPSLDRVSGTERLFMGPLMTRKYFLGPYISQLSIDKSRGAVCADYQFPQPEPDRVRMLLIDYIDADLARNVYQTYISSVSQYHQGQPLGIAVQLFKMPDGYLFCRLRGSQLAIINGARRKMSPLLLARQLDYYN